MDITYAILSDNINITYQILKTSCSSTKAALIHSFRWVKATGCGLFQCILMMHYQIGMWNIWRPSLLLFLLLFLSSFCRVVGDVALFPHTQTLIERDDLWLQLDFFFIFHHWTIHLRSIPRKSLFPWWDRLQIHCRWTTVGYGSPFFFRTGLCAALPKSVGLHDAAAFGS